MTVFDTGPKAATADFRAGDIGYVVTYVILQLGGSGFRPLELGSGRPSRTRQPCTRSRWRPSINLNE